MPDAVLITGSGTGIGLATAIQLARRGFLVFASVPDLAQRDGIEAAAHKYGASVRILRLDVTDADSIRRAVDLVASETGGVYGVVHSAGIGLRGFFEDISEAELRRMFDVNVFGVMAVTRAVLPVMRAQRRGRIVILSSSAGRIPSVTLSGYSAGKFALEGFGESLSLEVGPFGIYVSLIEPGIVMTPHFTVHRGRAEAATKPDSPYYDWFKQHEALVDSILQQRRITPTDVARAIEKALTERRPSLRYVVGTGARLMIAFRRYLPVSLFERIYAGQLSRMVTRPRSLATDLSSLDLPGADDLDYLGIDARARSVTPGGQSE
jgi:NAD(P)-dependent dehydrogenase (short-subunit alcohol dehydrogenase family)